MIFNLYSRVRVKLGDEAYDFDRSSLMFKEVVDLENATGLAFGEWQAELGRYSIRAVAGLLHVLRKRAGVPSDFETLDFAADQLDVIPLHEDGTEFTAQEVADDIARRLKEAQNPDPTGGADSQPVTTAPTSRTSPGPTASAPGNGKSSRGATSGSSSRTRTPS